MRPGPFSYFRPRTIDAALQAVAAGAVPLAGGQSLLQAMRLRLAEPAAIVDINAIDALDDRITLTDTTLVIGALATHRRMLDDGAVGATFPWLAEAARTLGDVQVRNRGTVLGNVCWADPRANFAVAMLASDAVIDVAGTTGGAVSIPVDSFFTGFRENALQGLAVALRVPRAPGARGTYLEFSRQPCDLALCNVCVVHGEAATRIALGGIHCTPVRLNAVEHDVRAHGQVPALAAVRGALAALDLEPIVDHHGSTAYKLDVAATLVTRALAACLGSRT